MEKCNKCKLYESTILMVYPENICYGKGLLTDKTPCNYIEKENDNAENLCAGL